MNLHSKFGASLTVSVIAGVFFILGCGKGEEHNTGTFSDVNVTETVVKVTAPEKVRQIWKDWNGRYVIFAHREKPVRQFSDFSGRKLTCALIEIDGSIVNDVENLCEAGEAKDYQIGIQNNPQVYDNNFLENPGAIAIMVPTVADHYKFRDNPKLIEFVIE